MRNQHPRPRIDVDQYYAMVPEGKLALDERVELIDGEIVDMPPIGCPHAFLVDHLTRLCVYAAGEHALVRVQSVVHLGRYSEPQPDLALLAPREKQYGYHHPSPEDSFLIVEVSDCSLRYDRDVFHSCRSPQQGRFAEHSTTPNPGIVSPAALPQIEIDLSGLLSN